MALVLRNGLFLLALLLSPLVQAGESSRLPLWEAVGKEGTVYLFGSVHVCNNECFPLPAAVTKRVEASQSLVVELDPRTPALQEKLVNAAMLPADQNLAKSMPASEWQNLSAALRQLGVPAENFTQMRPWMVETVITLLVAQQNGMNPDQGVDVNLITEAGQANRPVEELETLDEQIEAISAGTEKEHQEALHELATMVRQQKLAGYLQSLIRAWKQGDTAQIDKLMRLGMPSGSSMEQAIFTVRNERMAERIDQKMKASPHTRFVVVGVGHLVGKNSVPNLLAKRGYRVRQLTTAD